jgi:hypothetical protein
MSDQPAVLWGVRCTDPDPIGHTRGHVYAQSADRQQMTALADDSRCYELVTSTDGGETWSAAAS